jgi:cytochrome oxidase Cu insertion factor (SCO1/SenC/PrrC family)
MVKKYTWSWGMLALFIATLVSADPQQLLKSNRLPGDPAAVDISPAILPNSFLNNFVDLSLVDQDGRPFQVAGLAGRVVLFNFIFTRCGSVCPMQTRTLAQVFEGLPADVRDRVRFVSVSIDPENDTPARLQRFSKTMGADLEGWSFLTGDTRQIEALTQRLHIFDESETGQANKPQIHRTSLWLVDKQGRMLQRYRGDPPDKDRLIREIAQVSRMAIQ